MATIYICKCGRRVSKSTNADNTGNRDTENCKGCPYLLPWGPFEFVKSQGFVRNVKGYECRMSKDIEYATHFCGSIDDKCSCYIASLDFDFLTRVSNWIKETYPGGELNGSFFTDDIRAVEYVSNGRYRMSIGCAQNKKGIAAKAALLHQFFDESGARLDMTPKRKKPISWLPSRRARRRLRKGRKAWNIPSASTWPLAACTHITRARFGFGIAIYRGGCSASSPRTSTKRNAPRDGILSESTSWLRLPTSTSSMIMRCLPTASRPCCSAIQRLPRRKTLSIHPAPLRRQVRTQMSLPLRLLPLLRQRKLWPPRNRWIRPV